MLFVSHKKVFENENMTHVFFTISDKWPKYLSKRQPGQRHWPTYTP